MTHTGTFLILQCIRTGLPITKDLLVRLTGKPRVLRTFVDPGRPMREAIGALDTSKKGHAMVSIAVLGSLNFDLVTRMDRFPRPGETLVARDFGQFPGGKGANQAVACGRLGGDVSMFGSLGKDEFAQRVLASLAESKVKTDAIRSTEDTSSGVAIVWVNAQGENSIAIVPGANGCVDRSYVDQVFRDLESASWLLLQLEIPLDTLLYFLERVSPDKPRIILDPAPAQSLAELPTERIRLITPNEHELRSLTGLPTSTENEIAKASRHLLEKTGAGAVLTKAGRRGAFLNDGRVFRHFPGYSVEIVDSTAAGDAFNGALAVALSEGQALENAIPFANAAGALCVTKRGAQQSMASREEVEAFLAEHRHRSSS